VLFAAAAATHITIPKIDVVAAPNESLFYVNKQFITLQN